MKLIKNILKKGFCKKHYYYFFAYDCGNKFISFVIYFYTPNFSPSVIAPIYISCINTYLAHTPQDILPGNYCFRNLALYVFNFLFTYPLFSA